MVDRNFGGAPASGPRGGGAVLRAPKQPQRGLLWLAGQDSCRGELGGSKRGENTSWIQLAWAEKSACTRRRERWIDGKWGALGGIGGGRLARHQPCKGLALPRPKCNRWPWRARLMRERAISTTTPRRGLAVSSLHGGDADDRGRRTCFGEEHVRTYRGRTRRAAAGAILAEKRGSDRILSWLLRERHPQRRQR